MTRRRGRRTPAVGVVQNGNAAVLVTVAPDGELIDRRSLVLTDGGLPTHPHHHEGSWAVGRYLNVPGARAISLDEAVALVERVRATATRRAREGLEALAAAVPLARASIAIRTCPALPATTREQIADNRAQTFADSVMYREALATAAEARGWLVVWYDPERVFLDAAAALGVNDIDGFLKATGRKIGPPWQAKHKLAAAAALATGIAVPRAARASGRSLSSRSHGPASVDDYLSRVPKPAQRALNQLRAAIRSAVPREATEVISYQMPAFAHGGVLVWYAAFARHVSLFPKSGIVELFADELADFTTSKGTIQFPLDRPLPVALIKRIVKARVAQHEKGRQ